jgi:cytoskeleton protein RodZ
MILRKSKENGVLQVGMTNFGASFKQARESKGISLDKIATETRISTRFLSAIENEEFHLLPGGIFNRGFVRAFAEKVGLDADQAVADYERLAEVRPPDITSTPEPAPARKKDRRLYPIAIAALALIIVIFYVVTRESGHTAQTASTPSSAPAVTPQPAPTPAPPTEATPEATPETTPPVTPPETAPNTTAAAPAPAPPPHTAPTPAQKTALTLELQAREQTWIKVVADGNAVDPSEILESGMTRKFSAQNSISISIGNAAGVNLKLNDKPMKPLGKSGQVRELIITPDTVKNFTE